jgi:hypothetical protein
LPKDKPHWASATAMLMQDPRQALAHVRITSEPPYDWENRYDLIASGPDDKHFVVEIDNFGKAHLRFGNGELGFQPRRVRHFV